MTRNLKAFLTMIAVSELGRDLLARSDDGYNVIVGSTASRPDLFASYADHPRKLVKLMIKGAVVPTTAAGRYQILSRYFDVYKKQLRLPDFGKAAQDAIACQLIRECKALDDIEAGRFGAALAKCASRWASLPGAGYNQHENEPSALLAAYVQAGGAVA